MKNCTQRDKMFVWEKKKKTFPFETLFWAYDRRYVRVIDTQQMLNSKHCTMANEKLDLNLNSSLMPCTNFKFITKQSANEMAYRQLKSNYYLLARQTTFITITKRFEAWSTSDNCDESIFLFLGWIFDSRQLWGSIFSICFHSFFDLAIFANHKCLNYRWSVNIKRKIYRKGFSCSPINFSRTFFSGFLLIIVFAMFFNWPNSMFLSYSRYHNSFFLSVLPRIVTSFKWEVPICSP